jgi:DNA-binding GntR family transcriptional regulator
MPAALVLSDLGLPRGASLAERAADAIAEGVAFGALRPGERLVEADLVRSLDISRVPLREAIKILEVQGILETVPHRGTRVAPVDADRMNQTREVRVALEGIAARDAARRYAADPAQLQPLDAILARMEAAAAVPDWRAVSRADLDFHREVVRAAGNPIVATLWETLARHVLILFGHELLDERDASFYGPQHRALRALLLDGPSPALAAGVEAHIMRLNRRRAGNT